MADVKLSFSRNGGSGNAPAAKTVKYGTTVTLDKIYPTREGYFKRLLSLFEPAVIVFLAVMVLIVVVSIFVSMMELNSINQGGPKI